MSLFSQTDVNWQEAKYQQTEEMFWRTAVLWLILYLRIKGGGVRRVMQNPLVVGEGGRGKRSEGTSRVG